MTTAFPQPAPWRQGLALARHELRVETRDRELLLVTAPFGAVALMIVPIAVGTDTTLLRTLGPGMYWAVVLLFGVLVTLRTGAADRQPQLDLLRLSGVRAPARLAGRALAGGILLLVFELLLAPVAVLLYDPPLRGWPALVPMTVLVAAGLGVLGSLAAALAHGANGPSTLGPLLVVPLALPLLLGGTQALQAAADGRPWWPWLLLTATTDLGLAVLTALCARQLEEMA